MAGREWVTLRSILLISHSRNDWENNYIGIIHPSIGKKKMSI